MVRQPSFSRRMSQASLALSAGSSLVEARFFHFVCTFTCLVCISTCFLWTSFKWGWGYNLMNSESLLQPLFFIGFYLHHKSPIKKVQIDPSMEIKKSWPIFPQNVNLNYETLKYALVRRKSVPICSSARLCTICFICPFFVWWCILKQIPGMMAFDHYISTHF